MVDLNSALSIAASGMNGIDNLYSILSNNITNAHTPGYVNEAGSTISDVPDGERNGVKMGQTYLDVNDNLQNALYQQNADVAGLTDINNSLSVISAVQGKTDGNSGATNTLSDQLGNLRDAFTQLSGHPLDSEAQSDVPARANDLVSTVHMLSQSYQTQRQGAEDRIKDTVAHLNNGLTQIGIISNKIMSTKTLGGDTSNLENERLEIMHSIAPDLKMKFTENSRGDMFVHTQDGTLIPTRPDQINEANDSVARPTKDWPLSATAGKPATQVDTNITPYSFYAGKDGNIPGIHVAQLNTQHGADITQHLSGGIIGANIHLRDHVYPKMQAQLDSFSYALIARFKNAGTPLFDNQAITPRMVHQTVGGKDEVVPVYHEHPPQYSSLSPNAAQDPATQGGYVNLSSYLAVNENYVQHPDHLIGKQGDITPVTNVLSQAFGTAQSEVSGAKKDATGDGPLAAPSSKLGPNGDLDLGFTGDQSLTDLAASLTSSQGEVINGNQSNLTFSTTIQTTIGKKVASTSGVNINNEMSHIVSLQNAFVANAKVVSMVQSMFSSLMDSIH